MENTSWEMEQDLEQCSNVVERYWASEPKQVGRENPKYRAYRRADGETVANAVSRRSMFGCTFQM